jgi:urocanate hydratase
MQKPVILLKDIQNSTVNKESVEVSAQQFMKALNGEKSPAPAPEPAAVGTMKVHIEIERTARNGDSLSVTADIDNQSDLAAFHETYRGYLPRKKLWGLL